MPLIEYECSSCSYIFEHYQAMDDAETPESCPRCGNSKLLRKGWAQKRIDEDWRKKFQKSFYGLSFG